MDSSVHYQAMYSSVLAGKYDFSLLSRLLVGERESKKEEEQTVLSDSEQKEEPEVLANSEQEEKQPVQLKQ